MSITIQSINVKDIRFPTSLLLDGSDAVNKDPDYSATYVTLHTSDAALTGHSLIFTIGRGNDICCHAVEAMRHLIIGQELEAIRDDMPSFFAHMHSDSQLRWLGPEKGVVHMAMGAIINAVWDLLAKIAQQPLWRYLSDMHTEEFVDCVDFRYLSDAITRDEALTMVDANQSTKAQRINLLEQHGYPAYTTSAGWLGYSDEKMQRICEQAVKDGWNYIKIKVGLDKEDDLRRCKIIRNIIGDQRHLMIDANQIWDVQQAIDWVKYLQETKPLFIEEPTSPDDIFGHKKIKEAVAPTSIATGEHCHNRVMFKQFIQNDALDFVQIDATRLGGVNEILAVYLLAAKYNKPVCPHAGGVGLCQYVQHLSMIDFVQISATTANRVVEYVSHLAEHFKTPCRIKNGAYVAPTESGYSIEMHEQSVAKYLYPTGNIWQLP